LNGQLSLYTWMLLLSSLIGGTLAFFAWQRRTMPGGGAFTLICAAASSSSLAYAAQLQSFNLGLNIFWSNLQYLSYTTIPVLIFIMVLQYTGRGQWLEPTRGWSLMVIPLLTNVLLWSNDLHGLMRQAVSLDTSMPYALLVKTYGAWFWVHSAYSYTLFLAAIILLVNALLNAPNPLRGQIAILTGGLLLVILGNFFHIVYFNKVLPVDVTVLFYTPAGLIMSVGLFRQRLFELTPVARDRIVESMRDGILVLDSLGRVADVNPAAVQALGREAEVLIGQPATQVLAGCKQIKDLMVRKQAGLCEAEIGVGNETRVFELRLIALTDSKTERAGSLVLLHDITERKRIEAELRRLSTTDPLTGLSNRRAFFQRLEYEIRRARRYQTPLALIMFDLNGFKAINDDLGHQVGDHALQEVARALRTSSRQADLPARYGGDEFVILLPHTNLRGAQSLALRLEKVVGALHADHEHPLSISLGLAALQEDDDLQGSSLLARADESLLTAKHSPA
jgi:diguanylate cyclase (GGDEF)-like protein/PAS domain S-box-containing protein